MISVLFQLTMGYKKHEHKKVIHFYVLKVEERVLWFLNLFFSTVD